MNSFLKDLIGSLEDSQFPLRFDGLFDGLLMDLMDFLKVVLRSLKDLIGKVMGFRKNLLGFLGI